MQQENQAIDADKLLKQGIEQIHNCQFLMAVHSLQSALEPYQTVQDWAGIISTLVNLGVAHRNLKQPAQAIVCYQQALALAQQIGAQPFFMASVLNNLGISYNSNNEFQNALECFQQSLAFYQQMRDPRGEANVLLNLGISYHCLNHSQQANGLFQQAIQIAQWLKDLELEVSFRQLIVSLPPQQVEPEQEKNKANLWVQSQEKQLRQQGVDDTGVLSSLKELAETCCSEGKNLEAEAIWMRLLEILPRAYGENNLMSGLLLRQLATFYRSQKRYGEAESVLKQSLQIFQQLYGSEHPSVGIAFNDLAGLYYRQGRYREAEAYYLQAIPILRTIGDKHPDTQNALQNFQHLLQQAQKENRIAELSSHPFTQTALKQGVPGIGIDPENNV